MNLKYVSTFALIFLAMLGFNVVLSIRDYNGMTQTNNVQVNP